MFSKGAEKVTYYYRLPNYECNFFLNTYSLPNLKKRGIIDKMGCPPPSFPQIVEWGQGHGESLPLYHKLSGQICLVGRFLHLQYRFGESEWKLGRWMKWDESQGPAKLVVVGLKGGFLSLGCCNEMPETGWFVRSREFCRLEV